MKKIPYGKQFIDDQDKKFVLDSLSNDLITTGPYVQEFEYKISKFFKSEYSYSCSSGTSALHLAMLSIGMKPKDVILMPAVNFIASYNMARVMKLKIYLVDVDKNTGQITPNTVLDCIKKNNLKKIKSLILMYHGGYPENSKKFYDIKKKYKFYIIEDACHALGAEYKYKNKFYKVGSCKHSDVSTFSMHPVKTITSGEGGIISTNNSKISERIKLFRNHGIIRKKKHWDYDIIVNGYNYRLSDINCSLALSQLKKLRFLLNKRKKIYDHYLKKFESFNDCLKIHKYSKSLKPCYHLLLINIDFKKLVKSKDDFMQHLKKKNIWAQYHYIPIYKFRVYVKKRSDFLGAENYFKNSISLPIFPSLTSKDQNKVVDVIKNYITRYHKKI
jgi:dTDP-4-amino-4,6-dideoxygalactose transaminase